MNRLRISIPRKSLLRFLSVKVERTPNEHALKFNLGQTVSKQSIEFRDRISAERSPLAKKLFDIIGVENVFYGPDFITVSKTDTTEWTEIEPRVVQIIDESINNNNEQIFSSEVDEDNSNVVVDSEVVQMIKELLDTRIRPLVQDDGGDVQYVSFENGIVNLRLRGACKSCSSSAMTLKFGIENMLKHYIPEVESVNQVEDELEELNLKAIRDFENQSKPDNK